MDPPPHVRAARDEDAPGLITMIGEVFARYPGCILDVDEMPDLRTFASSTRSRGGAAWIAEVDLEVVGSVAIEPCDEGWEIHRLYVSPSRWGSSLGHELLTLAEDEARIRGARRIVLWSDTRFDRAHRFYERRGYVRGPTTRELHDKSSSVEYFFSRNM
jgi:GNAT superfamily N-acetyltransferase